MASVKTAARMKWLPGLLFLAVVMTSPVQAGGCRKPAVECGSGVTAAFDHEGRLWAVFVQGKHVYLSRAAAPGSAFAPPARVNRDGEYIYSKGENHPKIAFGPGDEIYLSWSRATSNRFTGDVRFTRSLDGGHSFDPVRTINDDGLKASHRFDGLFVAANGDVYIAWLDERERVMNKTAGDNNSALYYAVSRDRGATFTVNYKVADNSCDCCHIALAAGPADNAAVFWRAVFAGHIRDHALAFLGRAGRESDILRPAVDNWRIDACPEQGPSLDRAGGTRYHLAWFTRGTAHRGIYYGLYDAAAGRLTGLFAVTAAAGAGHPRVMAAGNEVFLIWKEFDGEKTLLRAVHSTDGGASWQPPLTVMTTQSDSGNPALLARDGRVFTAWFTRDEALRIMALNSSRWVHPS